MMLYVWIITTLANVVLALFLVGFRHYIRWGWVTLWTVSSVIIDGFAWWAYFHTSTYPQFWTFNRYVLTPLIESCVIWEAFKWREPRIRVPVEFQLGLVVIGLLMHRLLTPWGVYYLECFSRFVNLGVIAWLCSYFCEETRYD